MSDEHHSTTCRLARLLATARFEIIPLKGMADRVVAAIPSGTTLTITCSPQHGVLRTVETAELLAAQGYPVIPHLAASTVQDRPQLAEIARRLSDSGISEVFVIGGDGQSGAGMYQSAADLIDDLVSLGGPSRIGVAAYPEGHPKIPDDVLAAALGRKAEHAAYVVPQLCFDPGRLRSWIVTLSTRHPELQVVLSAPGAVSRRKLVEMSPRIGVGNSVRYLSKNRRAMSKLLLHRTFTPETLLQQVMADNAAAGQVVGLHLFTFNQLAETEQWRVGQRAEWQRSAHGSGSTPSLHDVAIPCCAGP